MNDRLCPMRTRSFLAILTALVLTGCNTPVREAVVEFDATGIVQAREQLQREDLDTLAKGDYDTVPGVLGPGDMLVIMLVDQASGGWLSSHIGAPTRDGPSYRYTVASTAGQRLAVISRFPGFESGDCVFVRKVSGEWKMGRAYDCTKG